jgi:hypothetical protein
MPFSPKDLEGFLAVKSDAEEANKRDHWLKHYSPQLQTAIVSRLTSLTTTEVNKRTVSIDFYALGKPELIPIEDLNLPPFVKDFLNKEFPGFKFTVEQGSELVPEWGPTEPAYYAPYKKLHVSW